MNKRPFVVVISVALVCLLWVVSCNEPVGGFMVEMVLNGERFDYPQARVYIDKVNVYEHFDGTIGYSLLDQTAKEYSHLLFTLVAGEWGMEPVFIMTWLADVYEITQSAGKNYAIYTVKLFPSAEKYQGIPSAADYVAAFNTETCYMVVTITKVDTDNRWINGIFNGVYVEQIGDKWWRMEVQDGRFGGGYAESAAGQDVADQKLPPEKTDEGK
ncbi:hypothetical protein J7L01_01605 [bacterium]|nr:hypothetical protein [bacterium]